MGDKVITIGTVLEHKLAAAAAEGKQLEPAHIDAIQKEVLSRLGKESDETAAVELATPISEDRVVAVRDVVQESIGEIAA